MMRVLFYGNQDNIGFHHVRWLRSAGIDAVLYLQENFTHDRSNLDWVDPELSDDIPEWIVTFQSRQIHRVVPERKVAKASRGFDVVMTSGRKVVPALALGKPVVFRPTGDDITVAPFEHSHPKKEIVSYVYRRRVHRISSIMTAQDDCIWAAKLLGVGDRVFRSPLPVDVEAVRRFVDLRTIQKLTEQLSEYDMVIFAPARKSIDPTRRDYKGSEILLRGVQLFKERNPEAIFLFLCGNHGPDAEAFQRLMNESDLFRHTRFLDHLPAHRLPSYLALKNVVTLDQFGDTSRANLGGIARECLAVGGVIISKMDVNAPDFVTAFGPDCPLMNAASPLEICEKLEIYWSLSERERGEMGRRAATWSDKYIGWKARLPELVSHLENVLDSNGMPDV